MPVTRLHAPGPGCRYDNADLAGRAGIGVGHVAAALLMPRDYKIDGRIVELVENRQDHSAGIAENCLGTLLDERIDDNLRTAFDGGFGGGSRI